MALPISLALRCKGLRNARQLTGTSSGTAWAGGREIPMGAKFQKNNKVVKTVRLPPTQKISRCSNIRVFTHTVLFLATRLVNYIMLINGVISRTLGATLSCIRKTIPMRRLAPGQWTALDYFASMGV